MRYGGMVGDEEDDEMERSAIVNDKGPKRGPNHYVRTSLVHVSNHKFIDQFSRHP